jgi:outer membrane protein assembly factor BamB
MASQRRCRAFANAVLVLVVLTLSACAVPQFWWTYQNDLEHTGYVRGGMGRSPVLRWDVTPGGGASDLTPPVFGSIGDTFRLFIGTGYGDRTLYALSPYTGATLWKFIAPANNGFMGAPVAVNDNVFAATLGQTPAIYALAQATGAVVWQTPLPSTGSRASVTVGLGRVFVNTDVHKLYALNQFTGAIQWSATTSAGTSSEESSPAVGVNKVYVGSDDGLYAFDVPTGALTWKYTTPAIVGFSSPVIVSSGTAGPLVLIGTADMKVHAVNANTGIGVWTYTSNVSLADTSLALADGRVFTRSLGGAVALDVNTGAVLWTQATGLPTKTPAIAGRVVYYAGGQDVIALDTATGAPTWKAPIPGGTSGAGADMAIALEILIVPNRGHVYAFK